jgi:hypothetical protein
MQGRALSLTAFALAAAVLVVPTARAAWAGAGAGNGVSRAKTLAAGNVPAGSVSRRNVTLTWSASTFAQGGTVPGYVVRRYNAATGAVDTIHATCSGIVSALTCTETNVPSGSWQYTLTPAAGNWRGVESGKSAALNVG